MKKYLILLILFLVLNCTIIIEYELFGFGEYQYDIEFHDYENIELNCMQVFYWINNNITWESKKEVANINRIMTEKNGDCKDMSFLMIDMLYYYFEYKASLVLTLNNTHAIIIYNNIMYDPTSRLFYEKSEYEYDYEIFDFDYIKQYWKMFI